MKKIDLPKDISDFRKRQRNAFYFQSEEKIIIMKEDIDKINWAEYETAYGNAEKTIPFYLKKLFSNDTKISMEAVHQLWCALCHQHAYISTATLPAYDILKNALINLDVKLKVEILDIFTGFSICTSSDYYERTQ